MLTYLTRTLPKQAGPAADTGELTVLIEATALNLLLVHRQMEGRIAQPLHTLRVKRSTDS